MKVVKKRYAFLANALFIFCLAPLALHQFYNAFSAQWWSDNARDFLVAKNIVEYGDFKWISPYAQGSENYLSNSVLYYYFMSLFYLFSLGNEVAYQALFSISFTIVICIYAYLFSNLFFKKSIAKYLSILVFVYYPIFLNYGSFTFQPNFVLPLILASTYHLFSAYKNKSPKSLVFAIILFSLSTHIHFSSMIITPWVVGVTLFLQVKILNRKKTNPYPFIILTSNFILLIVNQVQIKGWREGLEEASIFFTKILFGTQGAVENYVHQNFQIFFSAFGNSYYHVQMQIIVYAVIFSLAIYLSMKKGSFYSASLLLSLILSFPVFFLIKNLGGWETFYFLPIYVHCLMLAIYPLSHLKYRHQYSVLFIIFIYFMLPFNNHLKSYLTHKEEVSPNRHQLAAKVISDDFKQTNERNGFFLYVIDDLTNFNNPVYWLYLEKEIGIQLVENISFDRHSIFPKLEYSEKAYLICDNPIDQEEKDKNKKYWCLQKILLTKKVDSFEQILLSKELDNFSIYRINFTDPIHRFDLLWF